MSFKAVKTAVGTRHVNKSGFQYEIIEDLGKGLRRIKFLDEFGWESIVSCDNAGSGHCGNLYGRSVSGIGYVGVGDYTTKVHKREYRLWGSMFKRCYSEKELASKPSYYDKIVHEKWHCFQDFAGWCSKEHGFGERGWELDKDILVYQNKVYSPETCCFVPKELNIAFCGTAKRNKKFNLPLGIGLDEVTNRFVAQGVKGVKIGRFKNVEDAIFAYKVYKENYMQELAEKYKGVVADKVYQAVLNYKELSGENYVFPE